VTRTQVCALGLAVALGFAAPSMAQTGAGSNSSQSATPGAPGQSTTGTGVRTGGPETTTGTAHPQTYPGGVGATGSHQPDATNPSAAPPGGAKN